MLSKYVRKKEDCGCGGGKYNCISKNTFASILRAELKRLDCGCGCKGVKGFNKKYGKLIGRGQILADCPPGWRNDGLTCVEPCATEKSCTFDAGKYARANPDVFAAFGNDAVALETHYNNMGKNEGRSPCGNEPTIVSTEFDDGLTCRKKCLPGQIDDGLFCRNPIKSSTDPCPEGSRDVLGTCWGPVRQDCADDCTKGWDGCKYRTARHCTNWGLLGTSCVGGDCIGGCPTSCWNVDGITKQLHERNLKVWGGESSPQQIRSKQIRGRVNFDELIKEVNKGITDLFEGRIDLAAAFDPERNGVAAAFRKFGDDIKKVMEDVGSRIKEGFDKMAADTRKAFEDFARNAERDFKQFGEDFVNKMKDPDFWVEAIGIMAQIAAAAVSIAITVGTLGAGTGLAVGIMAAAQMAGPAAKMIADAARGRPIDALDIAQLAIAGATAIIPGMGATVGPMVKTGLNAAKFTIQAVKVGQGLGMIPSSCIANCPPGGVPDPEPAIEEEPKVDPAPGQKTDEEILALAPPCTFFRVIGKANQEAPCNVPPRVTRNGPPFYTDKEWIAKYRAENYGPNANSGATTTDPSGAVVNAKDVNIKNATTTINSTKQDLKIDDVQLPPPVVSLAKVEFDFNRGPRTCKLKPIKETIMTPEEMESRKLNFSDVKEGLDFSGPTGEIEPEEDGEIEPEEDFGGPTDEIEPEEDFGEIEPEEDFGEIEPEGDFGEIEPEGDFGEIEPEGDFGGPNDEIEPEEMEGFGKRRGRANRRISLNLLNF